MPKNISFYHWKSKALFTESYKKAISVSGADRIYMHYFDVQSLHEPSWSHDGVFPNYLLKSVAGEFQHFDIIPVIYITNQVLKTKDLDIISLSERIKKLVNQIHEEHFNEEVKQIQLDCDWTQATRYAYFDLIRELKKSFDVDVTIRLHQIKYKNKTGVPPVPKGTLMLYNVGNLKDKAQNSILESQIVEKYIDQETEYPLLLNIALPIFSQTVITNKNHEARLINTTERDFLEKDGHFLPLDDMNFEVIKDTLYKGFFLYEGYNLKLEEVTIKNIKDSYSIIQKSGLNTDEIIFYHLDDNCFKNLNFVTLINDL
ncbi:MAG: hypothetical protein GVX78_04205 [Bacteroidetes bacterium]|jgi:hypothetical protein|nr:hypothetical protein [Bacteroidota bacterium]